MFLYNMIATKRSGHHAVLFWLLCQDHGEIHYLGDPYYQHTVTPVIDYQVSPNSIVITTGSLYTEHFRELLDEYHSTHKIVINTENEPQVNLNSPRLFPKNAHFDEHTIPHLLVVRDIKNTFASVYHKMPHLWNKIIMAWQTHVLELLGHTNRLDHVYPIYFNKWFGDVDYRKQICDDLDLDFTDIGKNRVPHNAGGSSFDDLNYHTQAEAMNVLRRYQSLDPSLLENNIPSNLLDLQEELDEKFQFSSR